MTSVCCVLHDHSSFMCVSAQYYVKSWMWWELISMKACKFFFHSVYSVESELCARDLMLLMEGGVWTGCNRGCTTCKSCQKQGVFPRPHCLRWLCHCLQHGTCEFPLCLYSPGFLNFLESAPEQHNQVGWTLRVMQSLCCLYQTPLETASIDVAVFCLSLMGVDYSSFLKEAYRVLKIRFCLTMVCTAVVWGLGDVFWWSLQLACQASLAPFCMFRGKCV